MRKTLPILYVIFLCMPGISFSRHYNSLLQNYTLPDIKRHALDLQFNSEGNTRFDNENNNENIFLMGAGQANYTYYENTRRSINTQKVSVAFSGSYNDKTTGKKGSNILSAVNYTGNYRFYMKDKFFLHAGGTVKFDYYKNFDKNYSEEGQRIVLDLLIPLSVGWGRIEDVRDMRQAIYIADNLAKHGVLSTRMNGEKLNEFAKLISTVKNKRFLDSRLRTISEVTGLDSFLITNQYIKDGGAKYFTTLYDYWMYGALFERRSGMEFSLNIQPNYYYVKSEMRPIHINYPDFTMSMSLNFEYEKPSNLRWQHSINAKMHGGQYAYKYINVDENESKIRQYKIGIKGEYTVGFYPNSRTNLNIGLTERLFWQKDKRITGDDLFVDGNNRLYNFTQLKFQTYYYLSPQFRIQANVNAGYCIPGYSKYRHSINTFICDYNITLAYSIF